MEIDQEIESYFNGKDMDLRKTKFSRFMDQKVTPDVLSFIAECIINLNKSEFATSDIWGSDYFEKNTRAVFGKPSPKEESASHEYDKFIAQPLRMLDYSGVLKSSKKGTTYIYSVANPKFLEYISIKERNAFIFIYYYVTKVLKDSDMLRYFEGFKQRSLSHQAKQEDLKTLKDKFQSFIRGNTPITGNLEINRIFPKILNIYSHWNNIQGTAKGHLTPYPVIFQDLMYNRTNFRDIGKDKQISRAKAKEIKIQDIEYTNYIVEKAKDIIRKKYSYSEVRDKDSDDDGFHIHHIFPMNEFPQFKATLENLIKLTIKQHLSKAHPNGNTQVINRDYQCTCLLAKSESIERSIKQGEFLYSKETFINLINVGLNVNLSMSLEFSVIRSEINKIYNHI